MGTPSTDLTDVTARSKGSNKGAGAGDAENEQKTKGTFTLAVFRYATGFDLFLLAVGVVLNFANGCTMPAFMLVFGDLINTLGGTPSDPDKDMTYYVLIQVYIGVASFVLSGVGAAAVELAAERQMRRIRHHYLEAVMKQEIGWFDTFDSGTLATRLSQNCVAIRDGIGTKFGQLFMFAALFIGGYVVGFIKGWKMALVLSAALPLLAAGGFFFMLMLQQAESTAKKNYAEAGSVAEEVLGSIRTVVAFGAEEQSRARYEVHLDASMNAGVKGGWAVGFGFGLTMAVLFLAYALGFWYGGKLVADGIDEGSKADRFRGGDALSTFFAVIIAAFALGQAGPSVTAFFKAGSSFNDLKDLIDRQSLIDPTSTGGITNVKLDGDIRFEKVHFKYPARAEKPVYSNLDLHIPAGQTVALVGGSGCGKSTAIQLVQRFYEAGNGRVTIDGRDIREYNLEWLRNQMSLVSQEPRLFAQSIADNIRDGRRTATMEEVIRAAKNANAHDFISQFPDSYDTYVGEGGNQLSGGQKQRIAIARAILRDPAILILDEATSALDNESEKIVQKTLDNLIAGRKRTTIVIAHRLTTVRNADRIIVLDNPTGDGAAVAESGSHNELMAIESGLYKNLVDSQEIAGAAELASRKNSQSLSFMRGRSGSSSLDMQAELVKRSMTGNTVQSFVKRLSASFINPMEKPSKALTSEPKVPSYWRVMRLLKPYWWKALLGVLACICAGLVFPLFSIIYAEFIGVYFLPGAQQIRDESGYWALWFVALAVFSFGAMLMQKALMEWSGQRLARDLRAVTFGQMLYQNIGFFDHPDHSTGKMSQVLSSDVLLVKGWGGDNLGIILQNVACLLAGLIIAFLASAKLAAVTLAGCLVMAPAGALEMKFLAGNGQEDEAGGAGYIINETITNIRTITAYNLQTKMLASFDKVLDAEYVKGRRNAYVVGGFWGFSQFAQFGAQALALWYAGKLKADGEISDMSQMMRAIFALMMAAMGIGQSMIFVTDVKKAQVAAARVYEILDTKPTIDARSQEGRIMRVGETKGAISIKSVNFSYPQRPDVQIFQGISFDVTPGQTVALVGGSGCGKSTIIQLLERFYDVASGHGLAMTTPSEKYNSPSGGRIELDDVDLRDINIRSLRMSMGLVSQEPILFNTTIAENICYGKADATDEEVVEAAKMANAHAFICEFPEGYKTMVGKMGGQLSGGQKQRIAIARAILRNPSILLLDEATSALDSESEKIVQESLDRLLATSKRTTIVVAHRLSTIQNADKIVVLANPNRTGSSVVETGTHSELLAMRRGVYRGLVQVATASERKTSAHP